MIKTVKTYSRLNWLPEEEKLLKELAQISTERCWKKIAEQINSQFPDKCRSGKQCRERYMNFARFDSLSPKILGWTSQEDGKLFEEFVWNGPKWTQMSEKFVGRSENCLKNRFNGALRKISRKLNKGPVKKKVFQNKSIKPIQIFKIMKQANQILKQQEEITFQDKEKKISMKELVNLLIKFASKQDGMIEEAEKMEFFKKLNYFYFLAGRKVSSRTDSTSTQTFQDQYKKIPQNNKLNQQIFDSIKLSIELPKIQPQFKHQTQITRIFSQQISFINEQASYQNVEVNLLWLENKSLEDQLSIILKQDFGLSSMELVKK